MNVDRRKFLAVGASLAAMSASPFGFGCGSVAAETEGGEGPSDDGPRKLALLVGISHYERGGDPGKRKLKELHSQADVEALRTVLQERFDFRDKDIVVLSDERATRAAIVKAFEDHLIGQARPGDVAVFHFSGHGQQLADDNGDEFDGLDESLVPFDYAGYTAKDNAKKNLRDDQLSDLLLRMRRKMEGADGKVKGNITVFLDCCCSGTATRGETGRMTVRGRGWIEDIDGPRPQPLVRNRGDTAGGMLGTGEAIARGYVALSACCNDQTAIETRDERGRSMGLFTYHLTRALSRATPQTTYRDLFERVSVDVNGARPSQDPQLEGEIDQLLFAGTARKVSPYLVVKKVKRDGAILLPVGELHGATTGSLFALFAAGSDVGRPANRIAVAEVSKVGETTCEALLTEEYQGKVGIEARKAARAVKIRHEYSGSPLRLLVEDEGGWAKPLRELDIVTTEMVTPGNYDVKIRRDKGHLLLERADGSLRAKLPNNDQAPAAFIEALRAEWRWRFLSQLHNDDPAAAKVELRVVPVKVQTNARGEVTRVLGERTDMRPTAGNRLAFHEGDHLVLDLRNTSPTKDLWVTVLELSPDGGIAPIFPHPETGRAQENKVPCGGKWLRPPSPPGGPYVFRLEKPLGKYAYKVIATSEPADFSSLLHRPTLQARGGEKLLSALPRSAHPLGQLLLSAALGQRGSRMAASAPADWAAADAPFEILPK